MNKFGNDQEVRLVFFWYSVFGRGVNVVAEKQRRRCAAGRIPATDVYGWGLFIPLFLIFLSLFGNEVGIFEIVDAHGAAYVLERSGCHTASFFATTS